MEASWELLGLSGEVLGLAWAPLGLQNGVQEGSTVWAEGVFYPILLLLSFFSSSERLREPSWEDFGSILVPSGPILGRFFGIFGRLFGMLSGLWGPQ